MIFQNLIFIHMIPFCISFYPCWGLRQPEYRTCTSVYQYFINFLFLRNLQHRLQHICFSEYLSHLYIDSTQNQFQELKKVTFYCNENVTKMLFQILYFGSYWNISYSFPSKYSILKFQFFLLWHSSKILAKRWHYSSSFCRGESNKKQQLA